MFEKIILQVEWQIKIILQVEWQIIITFPGGMTDLVILIHVTWASEGLIMVNDGCNQGK